MWRWTMRQRWAICFGWRKRRFYARLKGPSACSRGHRNASRLTPTNSGPRIFSIFPARFYARFRLIREADSSSLCCAPNRRTLRGSGGGAQMDGNSIRASRRMHDPASAGNGVPICDPGERAPAQTIGSTAFGSPSLLSIAASYADDVSCDVWEFAVGRETFRDREVTGGRLSRDLHIEHGAS